MYNSIHYLKYILGFESQRSETTQAERDCLRKYAMGRKALAEIGVWHGLNSCSFRKVMAEDGVLILIDPYPRRWFGIRGFGWARAIAHREVGKLSRGIVFWVEDLGCRAPLHAEVKAILPVDFLFIDGDHSYEGIESDWVAWKEHIESGGILALHDSRNRNYCGSEKFTTEVILRDPGFRVLCTVDSLTVLQRK